MFNSLNQQIKRESLFGYCDYTNNGRPFYVGIGCFRRICNKKRNKKHTAVSAKYGFKRNIETFVTPSSNENWKLLCKWEIEKIAELATFHKEGNIGCNFTIGDGARGFKRIKSATERKKISDSKKKLYASPEARQKLGIAIHNAKLDPIKYRNHCLAQQRRYANPEECKRAHEANTQKKRVQQLTIDDVIIAEFPSLSFAVRETGIKNIKLVCRGKRKVAGGYHWRYVTEFMEKTQ